MKYACTKCGKVSEERRCPECRRDPNAHWSGWRNRGEQDRFRKQVLKAAGERCQYVDRSEGRCPVTGAQHLQAHHVTPTVGAALCSYHHRLVDKHAR